MLVYNFKMRKLRLKLKWGEGQGGGGTLVCQMLQDLKEPSSNLDKDRLQIYAPNFLQLKF